MGKGEIARYQARENQDLFGKGLIQLIYLLCQSKGGYVSAVVCILLLFHLCFSNGVRDCVAIISWIPGRRFKLLDCSLTLSQPTNFTLFETERVCRQKCQIWWKWQEVIKMGRKHRESEKLRVTNNFSFSHSIFKILVLQRQKPVLVWDIVGTGGVVPRT